MRKISLILGLVASLFGTSAYADFTGKNAAGTTITFKNSGDCTAVVCVAQQQPVDSTGAAFGVTANPFFMTIGSGEVVSGAYASGSISSGAMVDLGSQADSACSTDNGSCSLIALQKRGNQNLTTLNTTAGSAIPAGTNKIGTIDPATIATWGLMSGTTPGTAPTNTLIAGGIYNSTAPTLTTGQTVPLQVGPRGGLLIGGAGYPIGSTPITISGTGTTGATTATLATGASVTTYICGFSIRANATAAATGNATVTGTITGTLNYTQWTAPNASGLGVTEQIFTPCIPASAVNTGIAVISAAPGTGGVVSVTAWGFTL